MALCDITEFGPIKRGQDCKGKVLPVLVDGEMEVYLCTAHVRLVRTEVPVRILKGS